MHCPRCGTKNPADSLNCFSCGQSMNQPPVGPVKSQPNGVAAQPKRQAPKEFGRVDIGGRFLTVTDELITFENHQLKPSEITGIRFGVYKRYVNGIRVEQSYCIWLTNGRVQMQIECASGIFVRGATVEARYQQALKALWEPVIVALMGIFIDALHAGAGFSVGDITFNKSGLHRAGKVGAVQKGLVKLWHSTLGGRSPEEWERDQLYLAWQDFGGHNLSEGTVYLHRKKRGVWAQFALRDVWNAVCLDPLFSYLYEGGRLWTVIGQ